MKIKVCRALALVSALFACSHTAGARAADIYADLSGSGIEGKGAAIVPLRNFEWSYEHRAWRVTGIAGAFAVRFPSPVPGIFKLKVRHLSSEYSKCPGGGYAPVTITANDTPVVSDFDPASGHGGSHGWVTDTWPVRVRRGPNNLIFSVSRQCSNYVIQRVELAAPPAAAKQARRAPKSAQALYAGALAAHKKGDYTSAIIALSKAVAQDPDLEQKALAWMADSYGRRGYAYYSGGEYSKAVDDLAESLRINPGSQTFRKVYAAASEKLRKEGPVARRAVSRPSQDDGSLKELRRLLLRAAELEVLYKSERGTYTSDLNALAKLSIGGGDFRDRLLAVIEPGSFSVEPSGEDFRVFALPRGGGVRAVVSSTEIGALAKPLGEKKGGNSRPNKKKLLLGLVILTPLIVISFLFPWRSLFRAVSSYLPAKKGFPADRGGHDASGVPDLSPAAPEGRSSVPSPSVPAPDAYSEAAAVFARDGDHRQALETLLKKPRPQLTLSDYNLCFEVYLNLGDAERAGSLLSTISTEVGERHPVERGPGRLSFEQRRRKGHMPADIKSRPEMLPETYLGLARLARSKSHPEFAPQLCRLAADTLLTTFSPAGDPAKYYDLASAFEAEGELKPALELFQLIDYEDSSSRASRLKLRTAIAPEPRPAAPSQASVSAPDPATPASGKLLAGRYELGGALGAGGMAIIYRGRDRKIGDEVAVKLMHAYLKEYPEEFERFRTEAKIVGALHHDNIVGIRELVEQDGDIYLVFDYVEGKTLYAVLKEEKRLPLDYCKKILAGVCDAVHYAHNNNVIHRDLKPANIMMAPGEKAMVMDFGLSCELRDGLTRVSHQTMSGTPAYMAPEQQAGLVKRESDIYAMGICLYEMLTGALPFNGLDILKQKQLKDYREAGSQLPWLPSGVDAVISRALEPEPSQRYADALDFWAALKDL